MDYGIRSWAQTHRKDRDPHSSTALKNITRLLDPVLSVKVPHWYFLHYYIVSLASSLFWGYQLWSQGRSIQWLHALNSYREEKAGMSQHQVWLCWGLMLVQSSRRLLESLSVDTSTRATMPISIYLIGLLFYLVVNVALWIEGLGKYLFMKNAKKRNLDRSAAHFYITDSILPGKVDAGPSWLSSTMTSMLLVIFLAASVLQSICHRHLASLRKYSLPSHILFRYIVCPHYLMECIIYLALACLAASTRLPANATMLCATAFVVVNLGVVADTTRNWWGFKFGPEAIRERWRMIPFVW